MDGLVIRWVSVPETQRESDALRCAESSSRDPAGNEKGVQVSKNTR